MSGRAALNIASGDLTSGRRSGEAVQRENRATNYPSRWRPVFCFQLGRLFFLAGNFQYPESGSVCTRLRSVVRTEDYFPVRRLNSSYVHPNDGSALTSDLDEEG